MRKLIPLILLGILLLNLSGFYFAFVLNQHEIRKEIKEEQERGGQAGNWLLTIDQQAFDNIQWIEKGKEFRFNNKVFDVFGIQSVNGKVKIYAREDVEETQLIREFLSLVRQQPDSTGPNSPMKLLLEHFLKEYIAADTSNTFHQPTVKDSNTNSELTFYTSFINTKLTPPPDTSACS